MDQNRINEIRNEDVKKLDKVQSEVDGIITSMTDAIRKKYKALKDKIAERIEKKADILISPRSKAEVLKLAKEALRKNRKELFFGEVLIPHLIDVQKHADIALHRESMRRGICSEKNFYKIAYLLITEKDLEEAIEALPNIGLSENEKDAQIKELDEEIAALGSQIEKELKKV
jgi:hypothetical protein